ncbi:MAG TPA: chemotaxis response regulator protein-glutamate methylesterase [Burkholderiales bacterium]|nr:chemotaxis response regulator protein-glutamate methylesterase [Burkholderiales bacterium]
MIRVLVIDDSAVMRGIMSRIINAQPDMTVAAVASDPVVAMEQLRRLSPDVITLDVEMPRMNGLEFLPRLMASRPVPVVMVSSLTAQGAEVTLRALELGAVDFVAKPVLTTEEEIAAYAEEVADKLRAAAGARLGRTTTRGAAAVPRLAAGRALASKFIVIGASTGGVEALRELLVPLPAGMPPILVAQHMPAGFTRSFAQRLNSLCAIAVKEGEDGEPLQPGHAYIAPGGKHMTVGARTGRLETRLSEDPPINRHRPSVDALFRSASEAGGRHCIAVLLSGMGADGAEAMVGLRRAGSHNIVQDEASCVVFGMPKRAIALNAVHDVLPPSAIARRLVELCMRKADAVPAASAGRAP